jgi:hypothetical protein
MRTLAISLALLAVPPAASAEPITAANWQRHPAVSEIRAIYQEVRRAETTARLRKEQQTFSYCRAYEDTERILYLDNGGVARSYHTGRGSDDSATQSAYYYDRDGLLRFVFVKAGAVNGTAIEYRIYISTAGKRLWEERRDLQGPGYTFSMQLPDDWLIREPRRAFQAQHPCADNER